MNDFVLAKVCNSRLEADVLKGFLENEGVEVIIQADDAGGLLPQLSFLNGVSLFVPRSDLAFVKEILNSQR